MTATSPRCCFYARTRVPAGGFTYDRIPVASFGGNGYLVTDHPPLVGDQLLLHNCDTGAAGQFRVVARDWGLVEYGSPNWPRDTPEPGAGAILTVLVEACEGLFIDEVAEGAES